MAVRVTILGAGGSTGVPAVGLGWGKCNPDNPKNRRTRPSILVDYDDTRILVDTSPDLREQFVRHQVQHLDAVMMTHGHADHLHGIDDVRGINRVMETPIDLYADKATLDAIRTRFGYVLEPLDNKKDPRPFYYKPVLEPHEVKPATTYRIGGVDVDIMEQFHGDRRKSLGFRFGDVAYSTDVKTMPKSTFKALEGVKVWIIGAPVTHPNHPTHTHVGGALEWIERVNPERAFLSHLGVDIDYETIQKELPDRVELTYDGMVIEA